MSIKDEVTNTPLYASLYGLKSVFEQEFEISDLFFQFTEDQKSFLKRKGHDQFPYGFFKITTLRIEKNQANLKAIQQLGRMSVSGTTNATVSKNYMFPTVLNVELVYRNSSLQDTLHFIEHFLLLGVTDKLSFKLQYDDATSWICRVSIPDATVSMAEAQLSNHADPGALELTLPFELHTQSGFIRDVSRMQREHQMHIVTV